MTSVDQCERAPHDAYLLNVKTVETVLIKYIIEAETIEEAKDIAIEGYIKPYRAELLDGVDVIHAEAIK